MTPRFTLRDLTREAHDRVDSKLSTFDLAIRESYADFLAVQAAAFLPVEAALDAAGAGNLLPDWPDRRRSDKVLADLEALCRPWPAPVEAPPYSDASSIWGGLYVLEGSRLGGAMLRKTVPADFPQSFMAPLSNKTAWTDFIAALERNLASDVEVRRAGLAAIATFACFERAYVKGMKNNEMDRPVADG